MGSDVVRASMALLFVILSSSVLYGSVGLAHAWQMPTQTRALPRITTLEGQFRPDQGNTPVTRLDPISIYANANRSVVVVQGSKSVTSIGLFGMRSSIETVLGSGFVVKYSDSFYLATNFHVVDQAVNVTVTFWNGDAYQANVTGTDPYSDVAILTANAPTSDLIPLGFDSSSSIRVGQPVMAIGNPYGLSGSVTLGIVSQVGRTIQYQSSTGTFTVAGAIQFSAPINPGNSGGPLLDASGAVVGITSAGVTGSQGVGFAIPSDTIVRELPYLISTGKYDKHPYFGIQGVDVNYQLSQVLGAGVTYGVLIQNTVSGGPADKAGLKGGQKTVTIGQDQYRVGGDIIISLNGRRIVNADSFSTYIETNLTPGQTVQVGIMRSGNYMVLQVLVGTRPSK